MSFLLYGHTRFHPYQMYMIMWWVPSESNGVSLRDKGLQPSLVASASRDPYSFTTLISQLRCNTYLSLLKMAPQEGLEPPTLCLTGKRYYRLSYWGIDLLQRLSQVDFIISA